MFSDVSDNTAVIDEGLLVENVNRLTNYGYFTATRSGNAVAWASTAFRPGTNRTNLSLVGGSYKDAKRFHAEELSRRESFFGMPCADSEINTYTIVHEYGHILQSHISRQRTNFDVLEAKYAKSSKPSAEKLSKIYKKEEVAQAKKMYEEIVEIAKKNNPNFSLKDNLSKYGHTNYFEFFAEAFANSQCGAPNELGKAMQIWLEREGF